MAQRQGQQEQQREQQKKTAPGAPRPAAEAVLCRVYLRVTAVFDAGGGLHPAWVSGGHGVHCRIDRAAAQPAAAHPGCTHWRCVSGGRALDLFFDGRRWFVEMPRGAGVRRGLDCVLPPEPPEREEQKNSDRAKGSKPAARLLRRLTKAANSLKL